MAKTRSDRITYGQKQLLVQYMEDHLDFAQGKFIGAEGNQTRKAMWEILAEQLNSIEGPQKPSEKWQRVWIDLKQKVKMKVNAHRYQGMSTESGITTTVVINGLDARIIQLLSTGGTYVVEDVNNVESGIDVSVEQQNFEPLPGTSSGYCKFETLPSLDVTRDLLDLKAEIIVTDDDCATADSIENISKTAKRKRVDSPIESTQFTEFTESTELTERTSNTTKFRRKKSDANKNIDTFKELNQELNQKLNDVVVELKESNAQIKNLGESLKEHNAYMKSISEALVLMLNRMN